MKNELSPLHPDYGKEEITLIELALVIVGVCAGMFFICTGIWYWFSKFMHHV